METLNKKTLSFPALMFTRILAALGLVLLLAACRNGGRGGSTTPPPVVVPPLAGVGGCANCSAITQPILLTTFTSAYYDQESSSDAPTVELANVQMYGNAANLTTASTGSPYYQYQGPITMEGTIEITSARYDVHPYYGKLSECVLPQGIYPFTTTNVGRMYQNAFNIYVPVLTTLSGGIEFEINAPTNFNGMGLLDQGTRLYSFIKILRINGVQCSSSFFDEIGAYPNY